MVFKKVRFSRKFNTAKNKSIFSSKGESPTKPKISEWPIKDGQHDIQSCKKFRPIRPIEWREQLQRLRSCFNCLRLGHRSKISKSRNCSEPNFWERDNRLLHPKIPRKEAMTSASIASKAIATIITKEDSLWLGFNWWLAEYSARWKCVVQDPQFHLWINQAHLRWTSRINFIQGWQLLNWTSAMRKRCAVTKKLGSGMGQLKSL